MSEPDKNVKSDSGTLLFSDDGSVMFEGGRTIITESTSHKLIIENKENKVDMYLVPCGGPYKDQMFLVTPSKIDNHEGNGWSVTKLNDGHLSLEPVYKGYHQNSQSVLLPEGKPQCKSNDESSQESKANDIENTNIQQSMEVQDGSTDNLVNKHSTEDSKSVRMDNIRTELSFVTSPEVVTCKADEVKQSLTLTNSSGKITKLGEGIIHNNDNLETHGDDVFPVVVSENNFLMDSESKSNKTNDEGNIGTTETTDRSLLTDCDTTCDKVRVVNETAEQQDIKSASSLYLSNGSKSNVSTTNIEEFVEQNSKIKKIASSILTTNNSTDTTKVSLSQSITDVTGERLDKGSSRSFSLKHVKAPIQNTSSVVTADNQATMSKQTVTLNTVVFSNSSCTTKMNSKTIKTDKKACFSHNINLEGCRKNENISSSGTRNNSNFTSDGTALPNRQMISVLNSGLYTQNSKESLMAKMNAKIIPVVDASVCNQGKVMPSKITQGSDTMAVRIISQSQNSSNSQVQKISCNSQCLNTCTTSLPVTILPRVCFKYSGNSTHSNVATKSTSAPVSANVFRNLTLPIISREASSSSDTLTSNITRDDNPTLSSNRPLKEKRKYSSNHFVSILPARTTNQPVIVVHPVYATSHPNTTKTSKHFISQSSNIHYTSTGVSNKVLTPPFYTISGKPSNLPGAVLSYPQDNLPTMNYDDGTRAVRKKVIIGNTGSSPNKQINATQVLSSNEMMPEKENVLKCLETKKMGGENGRADEENELHKFEKRTRNATKAVGKEKKGVKSKKERGNPTNATTLNDESIENNKKTNVKRGNKINQKDRTTDTKNKSTSKRFSRIKINHETNAKEGSIASDKRKRRNDLNESENQIVPNRETERQLRKRTSSNRTKTSDEEMKSVKSRNPASNRGEFLSPVSSYISCEKDVEYIDALCPPEKQLLQTMSSSKASDDISSKKKLYMISVDGKCVLLSFDGESPVMPSAYILNTLQNRQTLPTTVENSTVPSNSTVTETDERFPLKLLDVPEKKGYDNGTLGYCDEDVSDACGIQCEKNENFTEGRRIQSDKVLSDKSIDDLPVCQDIPKKDKEKLICDPVEESRPEKNPTENECIDIPINAQQSDSSELQELCHSPSVDDCVKSDIVDEAADTKVSHQNRDDLYILSDEGTFVIPPKLPRLETIDQSDTKMKERIKHLRERVNQREQDLHEVQNMRFS